jgi:hypothetical protein
LIEALDKILQLILLCSKFVVVIFEFRGIFCTASGFNANPHINQEYLLVILFFRDTHSNTFQKYLIIYPPTPILSLLSFFSFIFIFILAISLIPTFIIQFSTFSQLFF